MRALEFLDGDAEALDQGLPLQIGRLVVLQRRTNIGQCLPKDLSGGLVKRGRIAQLALQFGNRGSEFFDLHVRAIFEDSQAAGPRRGFCSASDYQQFQVGDTRSALRKKNCPQSADVRFASRTPAWDASRQRTMLKRCRGRRRHNQWLAPRPKGRRAGSRQRAVMEPRSANQDDWERDRVTHDNSGSKEWGIALGLLAGLILAFLSLSDVPFAVTRAMFSRESGTADPVVIIRHSRETQLSPQSLRNPNSSGDASLSKYRSASRIARIPRMLSHPTQNARCSSTCLRPRLHSPRLSHRRAIFPKTTPTPC